MSHVYYYLLINKFQKRRCTLNFDMTDMTAMAIYLSINNSMYNIL